MKRVILTCLLFCLITGTCQAILKAQPDEWIVDGPGGLYGVVSPHTMYSFIVLGPFTITVGLGFDQTRILFLIIMAVVALSCAFGIAVILKRWSNKTSHKAEM